MIFKKQIIINKPVNLVYSLQEIAQFWEKNWYDIASIKRIQKVVDKYSPTIVWKNGKLKQLYLIKVIWKDKKLPDSESEFYLDVPTV
jgi:hypothetical protein